LETLVRNRLHEMFSAKQSNRQPIGSRVRHLSPNRIAYSISIFWQKVLCNDPFKKSALLMFLKQNNNAVKLRNFGILLLQWPSLFSFSISK
jgi:hypothetical protein